MPELWSFEHSISCSVPRAFAWRFWTDVKNWKLDADIESVELNGPYAAGTRGATITRSSGRIEWLLEEVQPENVAVLVIPLPNGSFRFRWTFEDLNDATRMTQRISIDGDAVMPQVDAIARSMAEGIPAGMRRLCAAMTEAAARPQ